MFDPLKSAAVVFTNVSGPDNASVTVTEWYQSVHPGAGGYSDLTSTLTIETSLDDGQFLALVFLPFNPDVLGGIDPFQPNLTYFDPTIGNWALAVAGNTVNSPGFPWPIGDRVIVEGPGGFELTEDLGDYGVYWLPSSQQGFVWANVDSAADLALGAALCPPDCRQTPDGVVDVFDLLAVLTAWGDASGNGPCDLDTNGSVDQSDLLAVLSAWGPCSPSANSQGPFGGVRTVSDEILFPSGSARLDERGRELLEKVAMQVVDKPHRVEVEGHTDDVPITGVLTSRYPTNWELAAARAARVVRLLEQSGIAGPRMRAVSRSEFDPVTANDSPEGRQRNRRIEIRLLPDAPEGQQRQTAAAP